MKKQILAWFCWAVAIYHLIFVGYIPVYFGFILPQQSHRAISLACAIILTFLLIPASGQKHGENTEASVKAKSTQWYDYLLMMSAVISALYVVFFFETILEYAEMGFIDTKGTVLAIMLIIPLLEAVRRTTGIVLPIIILTFVCLAMFQAYLPGLLYGQGYPLDQVAYSAYVGDSGIFGLPLSIAANIVIVFLIFGALMQAAGASSWFMDMAIAMTGWSRGGPAKAAVVSSALFGSISGGPSSNAATTGVFTIPLMIKIGYTPKFAAAVEAVASTGGIILPPVMGSMAFIMSEWIDVPYSTIALSAAIPAILYYVIVFISVHLQASKDNIRPMPRSELPPLFRSFIRGWYHLIPISVLIWFLVIEDLPPGLAGIYGSAAIVVCSYFSFDRQYWLTPRRILKAFEEGVIRWVVIAAITASVGIMIGALELSGVGIKISQFIVELSGGNLYLTLLFVGIVSLIVGMGLDATPAYVTLATLMAPALVRLGVPDLAAHLYVVYWGLASFFTPPTCLAVFVTCGIAGSKVWETGWEAVRLGISAFIVPIAFVLNAGLLLQGTPGKIIYAVVTAIVGAAFLSMGTRAYAFGRLNIVQCLLLVAAGILLIGPGIWTAGIALGIAALALVPDAWSKVQKTL